MCHLDKRIDNIFRESERKMLSILCASTASRQLIAKLFYAFSPHKKSLLIDTAVQYTQLINGNIGAGYSHIIIIDQAHPTILLLPRQFATAPFESLYFIEAEDEIRIRPRPREVRGSFYGGENVTFGLPDDYEHYELLPRYMSELTSADYDNIVRWTNVRSLTVDDFYSYINDAAYELSRRVADLSRCRQLQRIFLVLKPNSFAKVAVGPLLERLPQLDALELQVEDLDESGVRAFMAMQNVPANWSAHLTRTLLLYRRIE